MNIPKIKLIKRIHLILSFIIFFSLLGWSILSNKLSITNHPLSRLGTYQDTNPVWMLSLFLISFGILINSITHIQEWNLKYKKITTLFFGISALSLSGVSLFDMFTSPFLHNLFAEIFFIGYTVSIFFTGMQMIKMDLRIGMISIIISSMMFISGSWLFFQIQSIPEIIFIILAFIWNFIIIYHNEMKKILKLFGL